MALRFIDSILTLLAAASAIFAVYLFGHALSNTRAVWAWITALALLVVAAALAAVIVRRIRRYS